MSKQASSRLNTREKILDAAAELVREIGAGRLTLEAVAERSGLSKGGLLYNFPSKDALLSAMVERMVAEEVGRKEQLRACHIGSRNLEARLGVLAFLEMPGHTKAKLACGLLAALAENPSLLEPVRKVIADHWTAIKTSSEDPEAACIGYLAIQGLRSLEIHDLSPINPDERRRIESAVMRLLDRGLARAEEPAAAETAPA